MDQLTAFANALMCDHAGYINEDGTIDRTYWATDGAVNHIGMIADMLNDEGTPMGIEDLEEFLNDPHTQEQAMDLAIQMMTRQYYQFLKANGRGLID